MTIDNQWALGFAASSIVGVIVGWVNLTSRLTKLEATVHPDLAERVAAIEAWQEFVGRKALKALHSPHTPELDSIIDEYERAHDLPDEKWDRLEALVLELDKEPDNPFGKHALCLMVLAHCHHKQQRYRHKKTTSLRHLAT